MIRSTFVIDGEGVVRKVFPQGAGGRPRRQASLAAVKSPDGPLTDRHS